MEAASRPSLELSDLPLEEPLDAALAPVEPPAAPVAPPAAPAPAAKDPEQTDLNFVDPELFLTPEAAALAESAATSAPTTPTAPAELELTLEDPIVDVMLTAPAPAPVAPAARVTPATLTPLSSAAPVPPAARPPEPVRATPKSASSEAPARSAAFVPIAKTAALAAAAAKVAAASAAQQRSSGKPAAVAVPAAVPVVRAAPASAPVESPKPVVQSLLRAEVRRANAPRVETPTLASWASARAATAPPPRVRPVSLAPPSAPSATASAPAAMPAKNATPRATMSAPVPAAAARAAAAAPTPAPAPAAVVSPPMDRDFIARNQVVERYLSGRLPLKGATDFERFVHQHPEILDEIGLPERVNAGLRLLEASGKPEPWHQAPRPVWQRPQVTLGLAAAVALLGIALALVSAASIAKSHRISALQKQAFERALDPATSTREIRLLPSRSGASNTPAITIGGSSVQLADFKIDESRSPYHSFRITIDRIDQGRVGVITNLTKDSNGHLRIALNSSALGPGNYQLTIEGLNWRGEPEPDSWVTIGVLR